MLIFVRYSGNSFYIYLCTLRFNELQNQLETANEQLDSLEASEGRLRDELSDAMRNIAYFKNLYKATEKELHKFRPDLAGKEPPTYREAATHVMPSDIDAAGEQFADYW